MSDQSRPAGGTLLDCVEVLVGQTAEYAVIWLHGLGADGHDFEPVVPQLGLPADAGVRFVFPHAPVRPVTINGGVAMRAWFDIRGVNLSRDQDEAGIEASAAAIKDLLERELNRGIPAERIVLAGFSQGGAMALHVGLRYSRRLAGIISLSAYLLFEQRIAAARADANTSTPLFLGHGTMDPIVPYMAGKRAVRALKSLAYPVEWHSYDMAHAVCPAEVQDIGQWLIQRLDLGG